MLLASLLIDRKKSAWKKLQKVRNCPNKNKTFSVTVLGNNDEMVKYKFWRVRVEKQQLGGASDANNQLIGSYAMCHIFSVGIVFFNFFIFFFWMAHFLEGSSWNFLLNVFQAKSVFVFYSWNKYINYAMLSR